MEGEKIPDSKSCSGYPFALGFFFFFFASYFKNDVRLELNLSTTPRNVDVSLSMKKSGPEGRL